MSKIKVANPVVEMDGDEMLASFGNSLKTNSYSHT